jgi:putative ABC transport system substrate-binding protein
MGPSLTSIYRETGLYAGKILSGVKPADLPVQRPTAFARGEPQDRQGARPDDPTSILARADEIIE